MGKRELLIKEGKLLQKEQRILNKKIEENTELILAMNDLIAILDIYKTPLSEISKEARIFIRRLEKLFSKERLTSRRKIYRMVSCFSKSDAVRVVRFINIILNKILKMKKIKDEHLEECKTYFKFFIESLKIGNFNINRDMGKIRKRLEQISDDLKLGQQKK